MNEMGVLFQLQSVFREALNNKSIVLTFESSASNVAEWDSLNHIALIAAVEESFALRFSFLEIMKMGNVGDLVKTIVAKTTTAK